jgi:hypothetical protein
MADYGIDQRDYCDQKEADGFEIVVPKTNQLILDLDGTNAVEKYNEMKEMMERNGFYAI